ncbi:PRC-barrel domain containing protein [Halobacterium zhouii]|uniref:PRC-barrel domain containing protein n=1 Tax=Halobacterium zhouii TaxID=2902624 RepID=UPI001E32FF0F|nr:PRC-barrel domain containing protein [Halobacterium zhouii]
MDPVSFDDEDVGKTVVNDDGEEIGLVVEIRHGTAYVEPDPDGFDKVKSKLGWEDTDEEAYPLQDGQVALMTEDEIHLGEL